MNKILFNKYTLSFAIAGSLMCLVCFIMVTCYWGPCGPQSKWMYYLVYPGIISGDNYAFWIIQFVYAGTIGLLTWCLKEKLNANTKLPAMSSMRNHGSTHNCGSTSAHSVPSESSLPRCLVKACVAGQPFLDSPKFLRPQCSRV